MADDIALARDEAGWLGERLSLDREFATVAILGTLQHQPFPSVVALLKRGQRLKRLLQGRTRFTTTSTMESATAGTVTFPLWVTCHSAAGRPTKQGPKHGSEFHQVRQNFVRHFSPGLRNFSFGGASTTWASA